MKLLPVELLFWSGASPHVALLRVTALDHWISGHVCGHVDVGTAPIPALILDLWTP
jgi:hypothetical protein